MKRTVLISVILAVLIAGGWYVGFNRPAGVAIKSLRQQVQAEYQKLDTYRTCLTGIDNIIREVDSLNAAIGTDDRAFSGRDEVVILYRMIDSLCDRPQYTLEEITPSLEEVIRFLREWDSAESAVYIPIRIKILGPYRPLAELVGKVENGPYFDRLEFCRLAGSEKLYPDCRLELGFVAGLYNKMGLLADE